MPTISKPTHYNPRHPKNTLLCQTVAEMAVSSLHPTVSSLKTGFAETAGAAPGFGHVCWDGVQKVQVTMLDSLIREEGMPRHIKIDVEGFELEVLSGLALIAARR